MAGIGFELKKMFRKKGIVNQLKAYTYSGLVTVGPMLFCMFMMLGIQQLMVSYGLSYTMRQLFLGGVIYSFIFSYLLTSLFNMLLTRSLADMIYMKNYSEILPSLSRMLNLILPLAGLLGLIFLFLIEIRWGLKLSFYLFYMELTLIWTLSIYVSALKEYKKITFAFAMGIFIAISGTYLLLNYTTVRNVTYIMLLLDGGLLVTVTMLWRHVENLFYTTAKRVQLDYSYLFRYPSMISIGFFSALGLYSHQLIQWLGPHGIWIENSFLMSPRYDVAVYYAFLSVLPTLVMFVVNLESAFYQKYKKYYDLVLGRGNMGEINEARNEMVQVLIRELSVIMGIQLFFSILFIALGIRLLPMIGFTVSQIDTFNILIMGFYAYIIYIVITVALLYFDDRKGVIWLTLLFLSLCITLTIVLLLFNNQGLSLFVSAFITLIAAFARLMHILRNLHYYTFSSQPMITNKETRLNVSFNQRKE